MATWDHMNGRSWRQCHFLRYAEIFVSFDLGNICLFRVPKSDDSFTGFCSCGNRGFILVLASGKRFWVDKKVFLCQIHQEYF